MNPTRILAIGAALLAVAAARPKFPQGHPSTDRVATVGQSATQVTIHRDPSGVPHIIADTEEAGFYGLGYAQAEDQLKFILTMFLAGRGEMAAAFGDEPTSGFGGPPTANAVPADIQSRMWRQMSEPELRRHETPMRDQ